MMVSVIIPNYNHASYLKQRINSVLNQSFQDFEVIILDDCSTDDSLDIIQQYQSHPKVSSIVVNDRNSGSPFKQWHKGIMLAKGEWIWIAESDDYAGKDLLQHLLTAAGTNSNIVLSYCQSIEVDHNNTPLDTILWWVKDLDPFRWTKNYINDGTGEIENYLLFKNTIPNASAVLFKRAAYQRVKNNYINMKRCGDWLFWIQLLQKGHIAYTAQPLNFFRQHAATTRNIDTQEKLRSRLEEEYVILQYIKENIPGVQPQNIRKRLKQLIALYRESYSILQLVRFGSLPFTYRGRLPLRWLLADYLQFKIKGLCLYGKQIVTFR